MITWKDALTAVSTVAALIFGYYAFRKGQKSDDQQGGMVLTEIGYVKSGIDDIKKRLDKVEDRYTEISSRLTIVEQSAKSAHKRLDTMEGKI